MHTACMHTACMHSPIGMHSVPHDGSVLSLSLCGVAQAPERLVIDAQNELNRAFLLATLRLAARRTDAALAAFRQARDVRLLTAAAASLTKTLAAVTAVGTADDADTRAAERSLSAATAAIAHQQAAATRLRTAIEETGGALPPNAKFTTLAGATERRFARPARLAAAVNELDDAVRAAKAALVSKEEIKQGMLVLTDARAIAREWERS